MIAFTKDKLPDYAFKKAMKKPLPVRCFQINEAFTVQTMEGKAGDFLMIGIKGEMYACDKEIFEETYAFV